MGDDMSTEMQLPTDPVKVHLHYTLCTIPDGDESNNHYTIMYND